MNKNRTALLLRFINVVHNLMLDRMAPHQRKLYLIAFKRGDYSARDPEPYKFPDKPLKVKKADQEDIDDVDAAARGGAAMAMHSYRSGIAKGPRSNRLSKVLRAIEKKHPPNTPWQQIANDLNKEVGKGTIVSVDSQKIQWLDGNGDPQVTSYDAIEDRVRHIRKPK